MAYDNARKRVVLFGGANAAGQPVGDTWEWDGAEWTQVATTGPGPCAGFGMAYDKARGKVVLFAGINGQQQLTEDTWEWTGPIYGCSSRAEGDVNCDGKVDRDDLTLVQSALGLSACATDDPRDLNQDGKVDALDAQLLVNKCTTFGCPYVKP
jgi:Dockerin type I domain/Galactose oxidase, central domain